MYRHKTLRCAGLILMLIGVAPTTAKTEAAGEPRARSQAAAQAGNLVAGDEGDQTDLLSQPVTLDLADAPLGSALEAIARRAGVTLAYDADILPVGRTVTLHASALPAGDAFARVLDGTGLAPSMTRSGHVMLARRTDDLATITDRVGSAPQQATVTGTVTDAGTGEALRGAHVRVEESGLSAIADADGRYTLEDVPPGTHTLLASIIGYREARQEVTVAAGTTASADFALTVSAVPLDEVVVTGTMVPTELRAVPSPVSVITAEEIERKGVVRLGDILRSVPGVGVANNAGVDYAAYVNVRGASRAAGTSLLKTYIDGVEIANPQYSLNQIDPSTIERIELIRGPQASTLYGSGAIAGVLQVFTKKGQIGHKPTRVEATLTAGGLQSQYQEGLTPVQDHTVTITGGQENLSYSAGASYRYTGEWVEDELIDELGWSVDNSVIEDLAFSGGLRYVNGPFTIETSARTYVKSRGAPQERALTDAARSGSLNFGSYTKPSGREVDLDFQTYGATVNYFTMPGWQHALTLGYDVSAIDQRIPQPRLTTPSDSLLTYIAQDWATRSVRYNTAFKLGRPGGLSSTIQLGLDRSMFDQQTVFVQDARQLEGGLGNNAADVTVGSITNYGYFAQSQVSWRDRLFVTAGIRTDGSSGFGADLGNTWSPRVGIAYTFDIGTITLKTRGAYGRAVRPPEPQQQLGQTLANFTYLPNEELAPESQSGYDIGLELYAGQRLSISVTRYNQLAKNLISPVRLSEPTTVPTIQQYQNVGEVRNTGWELDATLRLPPVTISGQFSPMKSEVEQLDPTYTGTGLVVGEPPRNAPESTGGFSITYEVPRITATLSGNYKGSWQEFRLLPYFEGIFGTDPDREPYRGSLGAYMDDYPAVWRYALNVKIGIIPKVAGLIMINNLLNDDDSDYRDVTLVRGRQVVVGVRFDSGA